MIPGFGVAGIVGIVALVAGLGMTLVGAGATTSMVIGALGRVAISVLLAFGGGLVLLRVLPHLPSGRRFVLNENMNADLGYATAPDTDRSWLGRTGTACRRCGRRASPRSRGRALTSCRTAGSSRHWQTLK